MARAAVRTQQRPQETGCYCRGAPTSGRYLADGYRSNQRPATWPHHGAGAFREQTNPGNDGALSPICNKQLFLKVRLVSRVTWGPAPKPPVRGEQWLLTSGLHHYNSKPNAYQERLKTSHETAL